MKHSSPKLPVAHLRRDPLAESPVALPGRTPSRRRWCAAAGLALALASAFASTTAWGAWQDSRAKLRFDVSLRQPPTHPSAGYFLVLPDGGVLPRPKPSVVVLSADGSSLESRILWWNSDQGLAIVFAQPPRGRDVHIYLRSAAVLRTWEPDCGLTPSPILCADPGAATLRDAEALGRFGEVPDDVRCWRYEGHPQSALSIPGDLAGRPSPAAFYLQAYVAPRTAGKTWIAPFTHKGVSEVIVAGRKIEPWKRVEKWGGTGDYVELDAGIQRVELLAACPPGHYFSHGPGVMWFTWAPPDATIGELGGARPTSAPLPGTSKWASRVLRGEEVVRSGTASIEQVVTRDGAPVAMFTANPTHTYWFGDETPIVRFEFQAHTAGQPDGTNYRWTFGDDASVTGATAARLLPGATYAPVSLTADLGGNRSRSMQRIYTYSTAQTSLERAADREAYRQTFLAMLQAAPERSNPVTEWNDSMWRNLFRTLELGEGDALLAYLFKNYWNAIRDDLSTDRRERLEELFLIMGARVDPASAVRWADRFRQNAHPERRSYLDVKVAEIRMFYLGDLDEPMRLLRDVARGSGDAAALATIRLGDIAFLSGDLNEAVKRYGAVQSTYRSPAARAAQRVSSLGVGLARSKEELQRQRELRRLPASQRQASQAARLESWKAVAVLDAAASETVKSLIDQKFYEDALWELAAWERRFPLSKISGDFIVLEARLYMALDHHVRARRTLAAYCEHVDATSYTAEAVDLMLTCMLKLGESRPDIRAFCETMKERLEFHPAVNRINALLRTLQ